MGLVRSELLDRQIDERTHRSTQNLRNHLSRLDGGNGTHRVGGLARFSGPAKRHHRADYRGGESDARRALLHARPLQLPTYLGGFYFGVILAGNSLRLNLQRLLDARLVTLNLSLRAVQNTSANGYFSLAVWAYQSNRCV